MQHVQIQEGPKSDAELTRAHPRPRPRRSFASASHARRPDRRPSPLAPARSRVRRYKVCRRVLANPIVAKDTYCYKVVGKKPSGEGSASPAVNNRLSVTPIAERHLCPRLQKKLSCNM